MVRIVARVGGIGGIVRSIKVSGTGQGTQFERVQIVGRFAGLVGFF